MTLFNLSHVLIGPVSKYSRAGGLGLQRIEGGNANSL